MDFEVAPFFLDYSVNKLDEITKCIEACMGKLTEEQVYRSAQAALSQTLL